MNKINLAIADDHSLFREGISALLNQENLFSIVLEAENGYTLIQGLGVVPVDVLLLDVSMPVLSGKEAIVIIKEKYPNIKILVLTMYDDEATIYEMINKGANGFLMKDDSLEAIIEAIQTVYSKDYYFTQRVLKVMENIRERRNVKSAEIPLGLTDKELEILNYLCHEYSSKEIAVKLGVSERTIEWHRKNIMQKTNTKNIAGVVFYAVKNGLVQ